MSGDGLQADLLHPWALLLLIIPALLLRWTWRRGRDRLVLPLDHAADAPGRRWHVALALAESLPSVLLAVAIILLAVPLRWAQPEAKRSLTNIEFALDVSCSMMEDYPGSETRYDAAVDAINGFIDQRKGDAFGLTAFGNNVLHWVPLTTDTSAFRCAGPFLRPEKLPPWFMGTMIGKALQACRKVLVQRETGDRMVVLVTDGYSWDLSGGNDQKVARELADDGIVVYAIHAAEGEPTAELSTIAQGTGGAVFAAGDRAALGVVFAKIDQMQRARLERSQPEPQDRLVEASLAGLAALLLHLLLSLGLRATPW